MRNITCLALIGTLALAPATGQAADITAAVTYVHRDEAAMILVQNADIAIDHSVRTNGKYPDILDGQWNVPYVVAALKSGILHVDSSTGLVYPHRSVSRGQFLKMMTTAFGLTTDIPYGYADVAPGSEYAKYAGISWRYKLLGDGMELRPDMRITHAEAAKAVYSLVAADPKLQTRAGMSLPADQSVPRQTPPAGTNGTIFDATKQVVVNYVNTVTPQTIKSAMLHLIRTRGNLADQTRNELITAVNNERAAYDLPPLTTNYYLQLAAQHHAKDMSERGYFSHYTPEGLSYVDRIKAAGYMDSRPNGCGCAQQSDLGGQAAERGPDYVITDQQECTCTPVFSIGENLAKGQLSVQQTMHDWMHSPHHRENILRPQFEEIGIGLFGDIWVQDFGRLKFK